MELVVLDKAGKDTGRKVTLNDSVFGVELKEHAVYLDVKNFLANQRQGTHKSKERAEISGSTRKIKRQKGTGTARAGSIKSPVFRGGGRIFGPEPRNYGFKLNKKTKVAARKSALSAKLKEDNIIVVEDFSFDAPKTKMFLDFAKNIGAGEKALIVTKERDNNLYLSGRNIQKMEITTVNDMNTYAVLNAKKVVLFETSVSEIENILS
ncbi:50S ribosomal protein L4 [Flavobacteriales bacterium]|jgi:large subunit ribosomal protein L4|nr:50S ribosomal protein L4 [Flavobacteriales bacterium]